MTDAQRNGCSMRAVKLVGFCLAMYWPAFTLAASTAPVLDERALREECSAFSQAGMRDWREECSAFSQAGMRDCLAKKAESSQKALRQAEGKVASTLSKWDEEPKYIRIAKARLAASTKSFATYREEQCAYASSLGGGAIGNALEIRRLACIAELNNRRAEQLTNAVADLTLK